MTFESTLVLPPHQVHDSNKIS